MLRLIVRGFISYFTEERDSSRGGIGAVRLCAEAGKLKRSVIANQAAYVAGWAKKLRDDGKLIVHAAAQAQKTADYILNRTSSE